MKTERATMPLPAPRPSLRAPSALTVPGLVAQAISAWRLRAQLADRAPLESGDPLEEYRSVCEFMRLYATLRIYQLALLLGTTGSIVGALASNFVRIGFVRSEMLRVGGLLVTLGLLVMEVRATSHWQRLRQRGNELALVLSFQPFLAGSRWNPLTTSGAGFYLHGIVTALWVASLFLHQLPAI